MATVVRSERFTGKATEERSFEDDILVDCAFENFEMEGANLMAAVFVGCSFKKVDFYWASMFSAKFVKCDLEEVDFRGATMNEVVFACCRLVRCNFSHDNLGGDTDLAPVAFHASECIDCDYTKFKQT
jgi:uncharacterized protein YjbI with pentapeptide repeats